MARDFTQFLPDEMLTAFGRLAVGSSASSSDAAFILAAVSRRWRSVYIADKQIWGSIALTGRQQSFAVAKFETVSPRGPIHHLLVKYAASEPSGVLFAKLWQQISEVRSVVFRSPPVPLERVLRTVQDSPGLTKLVVHLACNPHRADVAVDRQRVQPLPSITHLEIRSLDNATTRPNAQWFDLTETLSLFPNLESLVIDHSFVSLFGNQAVATLHLPFLRTLLVSHQVLDSFDMDTPTTTTTFDFPSLCRLTLGSTLEDSRDRFLCQSTNVSNLTHLAFLGSYLDHSVVNCFTALVALTHLRFRGEDVALIIQMDVLHVLAHPEPDQTGPRLCPNLKALELESFCGYENRGDDDPSSGTYRAKAERLCASRTEVEITLTWWARDLITVKLEGPALKYTELNEYK